jgi:FMN phosphatase YigB (HAD superfamily)
VKTAVVSNWDERLPGLLRACGFDEEALDAVVVSAEVLADKPDRRIFEAALEALGVGAEDARGCVHVGDSVVNDVRGAVGAGFGAALLWSPEMREGCAFDFEEVADEIIEGRTR